MLPQAKTIGAVLCTAGVLAIVAEAIVQGLAAGFGSSGPELAVNWAAAMGLLWHLPEICLVDAFKIRGFAALATVLVGGTLQFFVPFAAAGLLFKVIGTWNKT
jgi:hypothetical protein